MINTSNEYKNWIGLSGKRQYGSAIITLSDGTELTLDNTNIMERGITIKDGTSAGNSFQIGSAIINELTLIIANFENEFSDFDFTGAVIRPRIGLQLSNTIETLNKGVFTVDDPRAIGGTIVFTALDNMHKFDEPFNGIDISFPITAFNLLYETCLYCGVSLATVNFLNKDLIIQRRPDDEAITCREIVAWIAQLSGNFARCNTNGALELKWYDFGAFESSDNIDGGSFDSSSPYASGDNIDGGNFTDYSSGDIVDGGKFDDMDRYHHIYALGNASIGTDDVIITGIRVSAMGAETDYSETVLFGSNGYVIEISNNPLIQEGQTSTIANSIGVKIVGMRFRPCSISAFADPSREAGDIAYLSYKGNSYPILLTNISYQIGSQDAISCDAETPNKKQSMRFSAETKTIVEARKLVRSEKTAREQAIQALNETISHSSGLHTTIETLPDSSKIYYMHDKPTIPESMIIWKMTAEAFAVSTDGGTHYTSGMTADGDVIAQRLSVVGIDSEWIRVITSFTVGANFSVNALGEMMAKSGTIGPFTLNESGLKSDFMEFFDNGNYPLIWLHKPGVNGGTFNDSEEGSAMANYEPSVTVIRSIEDGMQTQVSLMARDDLSGTKGKVVIERVDLSSGFLKSKTELTEDGIGWTQFNSFGGILSDTRIISNGLLLQQNGKNASVMLDTSTGDLHISASGDVYIKGIKQ